MCCPHSKCADEPSQTPGSRPKIPNSIRLFRQTEARDHASVLDSVRAELLTLVAAE
jgi:hypothetical protein